MILLQQTGAHLQIQKFVSGLVHLIHHLQTKRLLCINVIISSVGRQKDKSQNVFQENKARQIFRKTNIFLPPDTHTYVFSENLACFIFLKHRS